MTLAELVSRRLVAAGFHYDDPALVAIRRHNAAAYARQGGRRQDVDADEKPAETASAAPPGRL